MIHINLQNKTSVSSLLFFYKQNISYFLFMLIIYYCCAAFIAYFFCTLNYQSIFFCLTVNARLRLYHLFDLILYKKNKLFIKFN